MLIRKGRMPLQWMLLGPSLHHHSCGRPPNAFQLQSLIWHQTKGLPWSWSLLCLGMWKLEVLEGALPGRSFKPIAHRNCEQMHELTHYSGLRGISVSLSEVPWGMGCPVLPEYTRCLLSSILFSSSPTSASCLSSKQCLRKPFNVM